MSYETLRDSWINWNLPAWIQLDASSSLQCRVRHLSDAAARLETERAAHVPDRFVLRLTESGSLTLRSNVVRRERSVVEVSYRLP
jgi:hypothetical protein